MEDTNMEIPMCSICDTELEYNEFVFDDYDGDVVWFKSHGYCPKCGRDYRWYDKYNFAGVTKPEWVEEKSE